MWQGEVEGEEEGGCVDCVENEDVLAYHVFAGRKEIERGGGQFWYAVSMKQFVGALNEK